MTNIVQETFIPRILEAAPDFEAKSTQGVIRLSDFTSKGQIRPAFFSPG